MAESQNGASSRKLNEKNSLLDLDIGKDFITSWKSMSVAEDNAMDFDFAPVSKDKKKSFNFDKVDIDFNLDADFGKIPSFNMDMSDLDTSSPSKRGGKSREKSKQKSEHGKNTSKADHFSFELDFDEFGSFGFESSIIEEGIKAEKNNDGEKIPKRSKCLDEKEPFETKLIASTSSSDSELFGKPTSTKNATTSDMDAQGEGSAGIHSQSEESPSKLVQSDVGLFDTIDQVASHKAGMSPDIEKTTSPQPVYQEAFITDGVTEVPSAHSGEEADQITGSQIPKLDAMDANLGSSVEELNPAEKPIAGLNSSSRNTTEKENAYFHGIPISEKNNREESCVGTEKNSLSGDKEMIERSQGDSVMQNSSITKAAMGNEKINAENQEPAPEILKDNLTSKPVDNSTSQRERGPLVTHSRFFMEPKNAEEHVQKAPSTQTTSSLSSNKTRSPTQRSPLDEKRDWDTTHVTDGKLDSFSLEHSRATISRKNNQPGKLESCQDLAIDRQETSADGVKAGGKLNDSLFTRDQDVVEGNSVRDIRQKNTNDVDNFSLNKQMGKNTLQNCPRISAAATTSLFTMKSSASEAEKSSPLSCSRSNPDPCGMKLSRTCGSDLDSSKSASQKDAKSLGNTMQNPILSANKTSKITHSPSDKALLLNMKNTSAEAEKVSQAKTGGRNLDLCGMRLSRTSESDRDCMRSVGGRDVSPLGKITEKKLVPGNESSSSTLGKLKKTHTPPSLKRKTLEEFNSSTTLLNPSKRLSQSPTENRRFVALSERGVDKEVSKRDSLEDGSTKSTFDDYRDVTVGAPLSVENNTYVQQAEACTKELEDICNMLSKKHEEAKEILVRAIVNNNKLLMLNHPLYEEKISFQLFSIQIMS